MNEIKVVNSIVDIENILMLELQKRCDYRSLVRKSYLLIGRPIYNRDLLFKMHEEDYSSYSIVTYCSYYF